MPGCSARGRQRGYKSRSSASDDGCFAPGRSILIEVAKAPKPGQRRRPLFKEGRKSGLVVLFVPSVGRDGKMPIDQDRWVDAALEMFGRTFGGATAYRKAKGI